MVLLDAVVDEEAHLEQAHKLYKSGNYKQALEHSSAVYERSPQRTDNLLLLGAIYYQVVFHFHLFVRVCYYYYYYYFSVLAKIVNCLPFCLQLQDYDMCIAKNEEALRLQPRFAECYGNMANAWKVINITWVCVELWMCLIPLINDRDWLLMKVIFCLIILQEKGDIDRAIRYYLVSIEVSLQILNFFSPN